METKNLIISKVMKQTNVPRVTLYLWDKQGLLKPKKIFNEQTRNQDRYYSIQDVVRANLLKALSKRNKDVLLPLLDLFAKYAYEKGVDMTILSVITKEISSKEGG